MPIKLRAATMADSRDLWWWRNDVVTRRNSLTSDAISWECHEAWYRTKIAATDSQILIAVEHGVSIGMIRFDQRVPSGFNVNIVVAPTARDRRVGQEILRAGCAHWASLHPNAEAHAVIRVGNLASQKIFEASLFRREPAEDDPGVLGYRKTLTT